MNEEKLAICSALALSENLRYSLMTESDDFRNLSEGQALGTRHPDGDIAVLDHLGDSGRVFVELANKWVGCPHVTGGVVHLLRHPVAQPRRRAVNAEALEMAIDRPANNLSRDVPRWTVLAKRLQRCGHHGVQREDTTPSGLAGSDRHRLVGNVFSPELSNLDGAEALDGHQGNPAGGTRAGGFDCLFQLGVADRVHADHLSTGVSSCQLGRHNG